MSAFIYIEVSQHSATSPRQLLVDVRHSIYYSWCEPPWRRRRASRRGAAAARAAARAAAPPPPPRLRLHLRHILHIYAINLTKQNYANMVQNS